MPSTRRPSLNRLALGLAAAIALAGCGDDDDTSSGTTDPAVTAQTEATMAASDGAGTTVVPETTVAAAGTTFTSAEGDYSVVFPGEPTVETQTQTLPDGSPFDLVLAGYESDTGFVATARGAYPDTYVLDVPAALQGGQDQALENTGGTLLTSQDITLQGRPGREFSASVTSGSQTGTQLQRVYLDGLVLYQQVFTGVGEITFTDPEVAPFFESFRFTTG